MPGQTGLLFSILIPTRERGECLRESLKTAMAIESENIEIIIQDNCSTDSTKEIATNATLEDQRVKYFRQVKRVSMRQNFESALINSSGDYVIIIGDDDAMLPEQFKHLEKLVSDLMPSVLTWRPLTYTWPGMSSKAGSLTFRASRIHGLPTKLKVQKCANSLHRAVIPEKKPSIYHGCASKSFLNQLKNDKGVVFCGYSPDTYFTMATILANSEYAYFIEHPFSINAYGPKSNGRAFATKNIQYKGEQQTIRDMFIEETIEDPIKDIIQDLCSKTLSFPAAIFNTYETAKNNIKPYEKKTNYMRWYLHIFSQTFPADKESAYIALKEHAKLTGTEKLLSRAYLRANKYNISNIATKGLEFITKLFNSLARVNVSAKIDGDNTVYTAAKKADTLLQQKENESRFVRIIKTFARALI
jgi:glycosyltransferase involved in cell wall biosynthesis